MWLLQDFKSENVVKAERQKGLDWVMSSVMSSTFRAIHTQYKLRKCLKTA